MMSCWLFANVHMQEDFLTWYVRKMQLELRCLSCVVHAAWPSILELDEPFECLIKISNVRRTPQYQGLIPACSGKFACTAIRPALQFALHLRPSLFHVHGQVVVLVPIRKRYTHFQ
eukprot:gnl/TRDRNA2_/TRDRNA2_78171_c0_seq3.p1 gnl/TRDRNA2_/TRDRNA2_78171_c0~~gnl/TRDRNA2_/TRDRNA2_78171_c0_seq3.p1  ORF type:complete len:116 (+),score=5.50 gnl/TRDRNA2_/TRDRNA2_78171_c0_seq3:141-488(+)